MVETDFTIADVLAWARTKPADERYDFNDVCGCAMYQFLKARGLPVKSAGGMGHWIDTNNNDHWEVHIPAGVLCAQPQTFGALAHRLAEHVPAAPRTNWTKADAYLTDIEQVDA